MVEKIFRDREGLDPNEVEWSFILSQLARPFDYGEVKFREQSRGKFAAYIDSRTLQNRLDEVVGPNWETSFRELATRNTLVTSKSPTVAQEKHKIAFIEAENSRRLGTASEYNGKILSPDYLGNAEPIIPELDYVPAPIERANNYGKVKNKSDEIFEYQDIYTTGVNCDLIIYGRTRSDVGTPAQAEPVKSAYSDSLKRAAVQWGVGRYLYTLGFFANGDPELPEDALPEEQFDFGKAISTERASIAKTLEEKPDEDVKEALEIVMSRYSPLVSLVQKRRILMNLKEITAFLKNKEK